MVSNLNKFFFLDLVSCRGQMASRLQLHCRDSTVRCNLMIGQLNKSGSSGRGSAWRRKESWKWWLHCDLVTERTSTVLQPHKRSNHNCLPMETHTTITQGGVGRWPLKAPTSPIQGRRRREKQYIFLGFLLLIWISDRGPKWALKFWVTDNKQEKEKNNEERKRRGE